MVGSLVLFDRCILNARSFQDLLIIKKEPSFSFVSSYLETVGMWTVISQRVEQKGFKWLFGCLFSL